MDIVQIIAMAVSISIFVIVIELIRRSRLKERYSIIWLAASVVLIIFSLSRNLLNHIAIEIGIYYPPALLFILAIAFLLVLLLHFSTIISMLSDNNNRLAQELGILKTRIQILEKKTLIEDENPPAETGR
jgi:hypothetical protein